MERRAARPHEPIIGPETRVLELGVSRVITEALMLPDEVVSAIDAAITATTTDSASSPNTNSKIIEQ